MTDWLTNAQFFGNPLRLWLIAAASALIGYVLVHGTLTLVSGRLRQRQQRSPNAARRVVLALLKAIRPWLVLLLALVFAAETLNLPARGTALLEQASFALIGLQLALLASALITLWLRRTDPDQLPINPVLAGVLSWAAHLLIWAVLLLFFLSNAGINVTTFVASLGIGGIAVALALQNVLGDLFASAAIGLDKPFEVGQVIAFGKNLGTVTHVGIKTTRIRSLSGEALIISNSDLLKELIHNYSRMEERRIVFGFRIPYGTARAQVEAIAAGVRGLIEVEKQARFDRGHFSAFGTDGLEFEVVYYVLGSDYTLYRDIQQRVNLRIMQLLEERDVDFAVPARHLRLSPASVAAVKATSAT